MTLEYFTKIYFVDFFLLMFVLILIFLQDGNTPLLLAVETANQLVVRELLSSKAKEQLKIVKGVSTILLFIVTHEKPLQFTQTIVDSCVNTRPVENGLEITFDKNDRRHDFTTVCKVGTRT